MKIKANIRELVEQITQAAITTDHKSPDTPLGKVYLRAKNKPAAGDAKAEAYLYLFSTNQASKTFIRMEVEEVAEEGQVLLNAKDLLGSLIGRDPTQSVKLSVPEPVEGAEPNEGSRVEVKVGKNIAHLPYSVDVQTAFDLVKALPKGNPVAMISANVLIEFIRRSQFCIPSEDNGQQLFAMGVLNLKGDKDKYIAEATDGCVIAYHSAKQTETTKYSLPSLLIPLGALDPLNKLLARHKDTDVGIIEGGRNEKGELKDIIFQMEGVMFGTVLRTGKYPNVGTLITQHQPVYEVKVGRDDMKSTLTRAANFVESGSDKRYIKLTSDDGNVLRVEATNPWSDLKDEMGMEETAGPFKSMSVLLNIDYLTNVTSVQSGAEMTIGFNTDKTKALVTKDTTDTIDTTYIIMPVVPEKAAKKAKNA